MFFLSGFQVSYLIENQVTKRIIFLYFFNMKAVRIFS